MKKRHLFLSLAVLVIISIILGTWLIIRKSSHPEAEPEDPTPKMAYNINIDSLSIEYGDVKRNQNLSEILAPYVSMQLIDKLAKTTRDTFDVRKIRPGNSYALITTNDSVKKTLFFIYEISKTDFVVYDFRDTLVAYKGTKDVTRSVKSVSGQIESSLWNAFADAGTDVNLALKLADVYAWTIDFYGIQKGDRFKLIYEELTIDSVPIGIGKILSALFTSDGHDFFAFYFDGGETGAYYDEIGQNLQRTFLKAPLQFSRISSRFSNSRKHPVLKIYRPHHGVDYAAPKGTPVVALGDGKVVMASWNGGMGHYVKIKHNSVYETGYGHLSKYGKGIRSGSYVKQGDVIGYVGSTGLSTGPHLDFRVYKNGTPVDPLKMESPPADPVPDSLKPAYLELVTRMKSSLDSVN